MNIFCVYTKIDLCELTDEYKGKEFYKSRIKLVKGRSIIIKTFPSFVCDKFNELLMIELNDTGLQEINENSLENCRNLTNFIIPFNKLRVVPQKLFINSHKLTEITMWKNEIEEIYPETFKSLKNLENLNLAENKLKTLPADIFINLINLQNLHLDFNQLSTVNPKWFKNLKELRKLHLCNNQIKELPENVFTPLRHLNYLYLESNNLIVINSNSFHVHQKFEVFSLPNNDLVEFDKKLIDNIVRIWIGPNPCADRNGYIEDDSEIRIALKKCFENYENSNTLRKFTNEVSELAKMIQKVKEIELKVHIEVVVRHKD